ncbi:DUF2905 family protein, partial [Acinetobacter baumannii]
MAVSVFRQSPLRGGGRRLVRRVLILIGVGFILAGVLWPWLRRAPVFHLPGDIV